MRSKYALEKITKYLKWSRADMFMNATECLKAIESDLELLGKYKAKYGELDNETNKD